MSFNPSAAQNYTGSVTFTSDAFNGTTATSLSGTGVAATTVLNVSPSTLSFGNQVVNTSSSPQTVTLTNAGSTSITISAVQAIAPFTVNGFTGSITLNAGKSLALTVAFAPTVQTSYSGTLTMTSTAPSSPNSVSLSGNGISQPSIDVTPPICGFNNDATNHVPNDSYWTNFTPPAVGGTYQDTVANSGWGNGCAVKRLTNAAVDGGGTYGGEHHYYSTYEPMSASDTKIFISLETGGNRIIDLNGNEIVSSAHMPGGNSGRPVWDLTNDMVFWQTSGNTLQKCTVSSNNPGSTVSCVVNHAFSEYSGYQINLTNMPAFSPNGWIPLSGQNVQGSTMDFFTFNPSTATKSPVYQPCAGDVGQIQPACVHGILPTADGGLILCCINNGNVLWGPESSPPWTLTQVQSSASDHIDTLKDLSGNPVYVQERDPDNTNSLPNGCDFNPSVKQFSTGSTGPMTCLFAQTSSNGWEVSSLAWPNSAWLAFSAQQDNSAQYFNSNVNASYLPPSRAGWRIYDNEILLVRVDANFNAQFVYRLALDHSRMRESGGYWPLPRAAMSRDGKYVIFDSDAAWGATGCGSITNCTDVYLIQVH